MQPEDVIIEIEPGEGGLLHATSPQYPALLVTGTSEAELREAVPDVLDALLSASRRLTFRARP